MPSRLFEKWLSHYDPIHRGFTPRGIANGVTATCGWCFPRVGGGYNLYRGSPDVEDVDYTWPVGAAGPEARTIANFAWMPHAPSTEYHYALNAIGGGGVESPPAEPIVTLAFDGGGVLIGARSNAPSGLSATPTLGGRFILRWTYSPLGQAAPPQEFRIYSDGGSGTIDYGTVMGTVPYRPRVVHFSLTTAAFAHGSRRRWTVRAVSVEGADDGNTSFVEAFADAEGPIPHPHLVGECLEV